MYIFDQFVSTDCLTILNVTTNRFKTFNGKQFKNVLNNNNTSPQKSSSFFFPGA